MHRPSETQASNSPSALRFSEVLVFVIASRRNMEALTGPHPMTTKLGKELGLVLWNRQIPPVGGTHGLHDTGFPWA